jgi:hypothetical protein
MNPLLPVQNVILIVGALAAVGAFLAWRSTAVCGRGVRWGVVALRTAGIAALIVPFLNPGHWVIPPKESDMEWAVLIDASASMSTPDAAGAPRLDAALATSQSVASSAKASGKKIALYTFDGAAVRPLSEKLAPGAAATDIAGATATLISRYSAGSPSLAGILILSDGRQVAATPPETAVLPARSTQVPISAVAFGGAVVNPDLAVRTGRRLYTVFKGQELNVNALATLAHAAPHTADLRLVDAAGKELQNQKVRLSQGEEATVIFPLKDLPTGYHEFRVEADPIGDEKLQTNNRARFGIQVLDETIRVLLVEGNPYWDTKFIAQLLQRERNYAFELVYRLSSERFFSLATTKDGADLAMAQRPAFPGNADEVSRYDLIILGRSVEGFLDDAKARLLSDWVKNGGALVLARGKPVTTNIAALEALYPMSWDTPVQSEFRWRPTTAGEEAGLFGADLPGRDAAIWQKMPLLQEARTGSDLKPFSQVLLEGIALQGQRESRFPIIVSRRFGEGQVVTVNCDDVWRWDFFPSFPEASLLYRDFWLQLFNWVVSYSDFLPGRDYALKVSHQTVDAGKPVRVRVMRRPGSEDKSEPKLVIVREGNEVTEVTPLVNPANPDQWDAGFPFAEVGLYSLRLQTAESTEPLHATVSVLAPPGEESELSADPAYLRSLAEQTGGKFLAADEWEKFFEEKNTPSPESTGTAEWRSTWDTWTWLIPMLGFFTAEWLIRRRNGLI